MSFVDKISIEVSSGKGGAGCLSFASSRRKVRGGPDGGDGGQGGSVIFRVNKSIESLSHLKRKSIYKAESGQPGQSRKKRGRKGKDLVLEVPPSTWMKVNGKSLSIQEDSYLFLKGGRGGKGNYFFKNSINQSPRKVGKGELGQSKKILLETKLQADIALISWKPLRAKDELSSILKIQKKSPMMFENQVPVIRNGVSRFSAIELPSLKNHEDVLRHVLLSKILIGVISMENEEQCLEDFKNIQKSLKSFGSELSSQKVAYFFIQNKALPKENLKKIEESFSKRDFIFSEPKLLEEFIEKELS